MSMRLDFFRSLVRVPFLKSGREVRISLLMVFDHVHRGWERTRLMQQSRA